MLLIRRQPVKSLPLKSDFQPLMESIFGCSSASEKLAQFTQPRAAIVRTRT